MATTPDKVREITGSTLEDSIIQPFITAAGCIMLRVADCTATMDAGCVDVAETYVAVHLLTISPVGKGSGTITKETIRGKYSVEYLVSQVSKGGMLSTQYGQMANDMLDGCLAQLGKTPVSFHSIGCH